jgi:hypothetical protein
VPSIFKRIEGRSGKVAVPSIGLDVGTMEYWLLTRREDTPSGVEEWDLRAVFSYVNQFAFEKPGLDRWVTVWLGDQRRGGKQFRLRQSGGRTVLDGRNLLMERVSLWPIEK